MDQLFDKVSATRLAGTSLVEARDYHLRGLREATGIPLQLCADANTIHCTDISTRDPDSTPYTLTWEGFIASSDYRDDDLLVFGAHLFPLIGGIRTCLLRADAGSRSYDYAFRYLVLTKEDGWQDRGWQIDENEEFDQWYCEKIR